MKIIVDETLTIDSITKILSKIFCTEIVNADFKATQLHGGTVGNIRLIEGIAVTADGHKLPYKVVLKVQKKWSRHGDPDSWRREYDFYQSGFDALFSEALRWPKCYYAVMNEDENEIQIWMEYINGVSGLELTGDMYERAAIELGRFQGKLYAEQPLVFKSLTNLSKIDYMKNFYLHYRSWNEVYDYIRSEDCELPKHLCKMLIDIDENENEIWSRIEKLPVVLCHRDFWVTNIIYQDDKILLIDWDTTGFGYLGEDIASLIADEADVEHMLEYYQKCVVSYYKGFSEYTDLSHITDNCIYELILIMFGYRLVECYKFANSQDGKTLSLNTLQKIYEIGKL